MTTLRCNAGWPAALALCALLAPVGGQTKGLPTYTAVYQVEYNGRRVGTAEFSVRYDSDRDVYRFESNTSARGFYRLLRPNAVIERSDFVYEGGEIRPQEFWFEDGSRRGRGDLHILFDWDERVARVSGEDGETELALEPGVLDRGSMQVALMHDMATTSGPGEYLLADEDSIRPYVYVATGEEALNTALGRLQTRTFVQQREGSSRTMIVWAAPELAFLPVRIERRRDDEVQAAFLLESVEGLTPQ